MVQSSQTAPGQFARAVQAADARTRAEGMLPPLTAPATISHGHGPEDGSPPRFEREEGTAALADLLSPGHPRNADGTVRPDGTAPPLS